MKNKQAAGYFARLFLYVSAKTAIVASAIAAFIAWDALKAAIVTWIVTLFFPMLGFFPLFWVLLIVFVLS